MPRKEEYYAYQKLGICPLCMKNKLYGQEKICLDCKVYMAEKSAEIRRNCPEKVKDTKNRSYRKIKNERLSNNLCIKCGRKKDETYKMCGICRAKYREEARKHRKKTNVLETRILNGLCRCGEPVKDGYKVCQKHYKHLVEISRSEKAKQARERLLREKILH